MRHQAISLKSFGTLCVVAGTFAGVFSLASVRTPLDDAIGQAGGIVLAVGIVLLCVSSVRSAIRSRREALAARRGFEVVPPRDTT